MDKYMLYSMLDDLKGHHRNKQSLMKEYVENRLAKSLESYYSNLDTSMSYLSNRKNDAKLMKNMNKGD